MSGNSSVGLDPLVGRQAMYIFQTALVMAWIPLLAPVGSLLRDGTVGAVDVQHDAWRRASATNSGSTKFTRGWFCHALHLSKSDIISSAECTVRA